MEIEERGPAARHLDLGLEVAVRDRQRLDRDGHRPPPAGVLVSRFGHQRFSYSSSGKSAWSDGSTSAANSSMFSIAMSWGMEPNWSTGMRWPTFSRFAISVSWSFSFNDTATT